VPRRTVKSIAFFPEIGSLTTVGELDLFLHFSNVLRWGSGQPIVVFLGRFIVVIFGEAEVEKHGGGNCTQW
jgi:hypothetical protein